MKLYIIIGIVILFGAPMAGVSLNLDKAKQGALSHLQSIETQATQAVNSINLKGFNADQTIQSFKELSSEASEQTNALASRK